MALEDLGPAERFAAGAVGEPGRRRFFFEISAGGRRLSLATEKEQVAALALQALQLLEQTGLDLDEEAVSTLIEGGLSVGEPETVRFTVGNMTVGVASDSSLLTVVLEAAEGSDGISFLISAEQLRAMALAAVEVIASGRPICPWCRLPMDLEGHQCAATNGHHPHD